jgi:hypothetical protein
LQAAARITGGPFLHLLHQEKRFLHARIEIARRASAPFLICTLGYAKALA